MPPMRIPNLVALIAECWNKAEIALQNTVKDKFPDRDEEVITELMHGELDIEFKRVSECKMVETAFRRDLQYCSLGIPSSQVPEIARGLIATVNFHSKSVERKTGGDFGLVIVRPNVHYARFSNSKLMIDDQRRGLLCQAKIFRRNSTWGRLTKKQREVLSKRLGYLSLVLYRYSDQDGERRELAPIHWQLAHQSAIEELNGWLISDSFPSLEKSEDIIKALGDDKIGTDDKQVISQYIAPPVRPSLEIVIGWPDGAGPGRELQLKKVTTTKNQYLLIQQ